MAKRNLFATIIGINNYTRKPLQGCLPDALNMSLFLRNLQLENSDEIAYKELLLLAPSPSDHVFIENYEAAIKAPIQFIEPTFDNIGGNLANQSIGPAFSHLSQAKDGDICVFYYSGHGSRIPAPPEFAHSKSDALNETLVCVDSRDTGKRDLIDKELAFLLWSALNGKKVHCLVIMDCCHSGHNTRTENGYLLRHAPPSNLHIPFSDYLGFHSDFYIKNGHRADIKLVDYVHLAAGRDNEEVADGPTGGLFTRHLLKILQSGGTHKSYRDIMQSIATNVRNERNIQNPIPYAAGNQDNKSLLDLKFLGSEHLTYSPSFEVRYNGISKRWEMKGGTIHMITATEKNNETSVKILGEYVHENTGQRVQFDSDTAVQVVQVTGNNSVLEQEPFASVPLGTQTLRAKLFHLGTPKICISLSPTLLRPEEQHFTNQLKQAYSNSGLPLQFFFIKEFEQNHNDSPPNYIIHITTNNQFVLTRPDDYTPLFKSWPKAASFLADVNSVCKWVKVSNFSNNTPDYRQEHFEFIFEKIEKEPISPDTLATINQNAVGKPLAFGQENIFRYYSINGIKCPPAFRLTIKIKNDAPFNTCNIGALYLTSRYGIQKDLMESRRLNKGENGVTLEFVYDDSGKNKQQTQTIPLMLHDSYHNLGINEISAFLKIFVSNQVVNLTPYTQENLELAADNQNPTRDFGMNTHPQDERSNDQANWSVFTTKLRIIGLNKSKTVGPEETADFSAISIETPTGFNATISAVTSDDLATRITTKSFGMVVPPADLFGDQDTQDAAFAAGLNSASGNDIQVLELTPASNDGNFPTIPPGGSLVIKPKFEDNNTQTASDETWEEMVIPYGFDETLEMFIPLGYSDDNGKIHITQLPPPSDIILNDDGPATKGVGQSIKLYFRKVFRRKRGSELNELVLYNAHTWNRITAIPSEMKTELDNKPTNRVLLLVHGMIGDTRHMVEAFKDIPALANHIDYVLTYDYECLSTSIPDTADALKKVLHEAGYDHPATMPELILLAHSMGGLVSRFLLEKNEGHQFVKRFIQVGSPNDGSPIAKLVDPVTDMLTHAINVNTSVRFAVKGLLFLLKALKLHPGKTLEELKYNSTTLQKLATSSRPDNLPYFIIKGDVTNMEGYEPDDTFLQKVKKKAAPLVTKSIYDGAPNDMIVLCASMEKITGLTPENVFPVISDHLAYFREQRCQDLLLTLVSK